MRKINGFTLLEMLIVIAIIMVLAGITFSVINNVKTRSKQTTCMNNLKQIGSALQLYAQDWNGCVPPYTTFNRDKFRYPDDPTKYVVLAPFNNAKELKRIFSSYKVAEAQWWCPLLRRGESHFSVSTVDHTETSYRVTYLVTIWRPVSIDNVPTIPFKEFDREKHGPFMWKTDDKRPSPMYAQCYTHGYIENKVLYVCLDGSVGSYDPHDPW